MIDLDRITNPLRLSRGSHKKGSGKGCAMNVISYINGDVEITDYPSCSARPLATLVQGLNDSLAGSDDLLSPEDAITVLDLGWLTVGTADTPRVVIWQWLADILIDPEWGVAKYAEADGVKAIRRVAELCLREASGVVVDKDDWVSGRTAAASAASTASTASTAAAAAHAAYAASYATEHAAYAAYAAQASSRTEFTRWAITHWRELAGMDEAQASMEEVDKALAEMAR